MSSSHTAKLVWITPDADKIIVDLARVSNPENQGKHETGARLISYLLRKKHGSPFEMANACFEVNTTRDIGRQILRHSSLRPQEFSQRYQDVRVLGADPIIRKARMQDPKNRQNSLPCEDEALSSWFEMAQNEHWDRAMYLYDRALKRGIAKEQARCFLPEGNTPTRMYFNGNIRSWIHFCGLRLAHGTQEECTDVAQAVFDTLQQHIPSVTEAMSFTS